MEGRYPRSILITGANRGLGLEFVKQVLANNSGSTEHVFATHRSPCGGESTAALEELTKTSPNLHLIQMDVTKDGSIQAAAQTVDSIVGEHGLTVLVNNSGVGSNESRLDDVTSEEMAEVYRVNSIGPVMVLKSFKPLLKRAADLGKDKPLSWQRAAVVHIASELGSFDRIATSLVKPSGKLCLRYSYRASKAALNMLGHVLSYELAADGIVSALIHPGWVRTDMGTAAGSISTDESIRGVVQVASKLNKDTNGKYLTWDGGQLLW